MANGKLRDVLTADQYRDARELFRLMGSVSSPRKIETARINAKKATAARLVKMAAARASRLAAVGGVAGE